MEIGNNPEGGFKISILIPGKVEEDVTLVIVDDEPAIAEGICRLLDWKSLWL